MLIPKMGISNYFHSMHPKLSVGDSQDESLPSKEVSESSSYAMDRYYRSDDASLSITTHDGDEVTLSFFSDYYQLNEQSSHVTEDSVTISAYHEERFRVGIAYSVEGELDEGERDAIADLVRQVQNVSERFFAGDLEGALKQALTVEKDASELAAFRLDLHSSERIEAVRKYEEVQQIDQTNTTPEEPLNASPKDNLLDTLLHQLQDFLQHLRDTSAKEQDALSDRLASLVANPFAERLPESFRIARAMFDQMLSFYPETVNDKPNEDVA